MTVVYLERKIVFGGVLIVAVAFVFGVVIGFFGKTSGNDLADAPAFERLVQDKFRDEQEMMQKVMDGVDTDKIKSYFEVLTKEPHIAALRRDKELVKWIQNEWKSAGLDHVELAEYDVYLSWPNQTNPNKIYLRDEDGNVRFTSKHKEKELREGDDHKDFIHAFNGYAPASDLDINLSDVVYTHFARVEDLQKLEEMGISLEGKICLAR
jgi:N-acetylated-alpha-linked acidic dipeptidase